KRRRYSLERRASQQEYAVIDNGIDHPDKRERNRLEAYRPIAPGAGELCEGRIVGRASHCLAPRITFQATFVPKGRCLGEFFGGSRHGQPAQCFWRPKKLLLRLIST